MSKERIWSEIRIDNFDEVEQVYTVDAWETDDDNEEGKVIAKIYPATCYVEYIDARAETDEYVREAIRDAYEMIHDTKIVLTKEVSDKIRKIAELNEELYRLAQEVNADLSKIGYENEYAFAGDFSHVQNLRNADIIIPVIEEDEKTKKVVLKDGAINATENYDGVFVKQTAGYCEDDFSGTFYVKMDDGKYVRIPFGI